MTDENHADGDDGTELENARRKVASADQQEMLRETPDDLRDDINTFFDREMDPAEFVSRLRDHAEYLERSASALEADEEIDTGTNTDREEASQ